MAREQIKWLTPGRIIPARKNGIRIVQSPERSSVRHSVGNVVILAILFSIGQSLADGSPGLEIHYPPDESVVRPGESITLNVRPLGGFSPDRLSVVTAVGEVTIVPQHEYPRHMRSYLVEYTVPEDTRSQVALSVIGAETASGRIFSDSITLKVEKPGPLIDLEIRNGQIHLHGAQASEKLDVRGLYIDGSEKDLSGSAKGTTYISTDPTFATVDSEGIVRAGKRDGRSTVVATTGKESMFVNIIVDGVNGSPRFEHIWDPKVRINEFLEFSVITIDPEGTVASLSAEILPEGATFVDNGDGTGTIRWKPRDQSKQFHEVKIVATDADDPEVLGDGWFVIEVVP
jgi:hypothetical protein